MVLRTTVEDADKAFYRKGRNANAKNVKLLMPWKSAARSILKLKFISLKLIIALFCSRTDDRPFGYPPKHLRPKVRL